MPPPHRRSGPRKKPRAAPRRDPEPASRARPPWWTRAAQSVVEALSYLDDVGIGALYDDSGPRPTQRVTQPLPTEVPPRPVAAEGQWRCPRTGGRLEPVEVAGCHLHVNQTCGGLMLEAGSEPRLLEDRSAWPEIRAFCAALEEAASRAVDGRAVVDLNCPGCSGPMHRKNFGKVSGVLVDTCPGCGTWFDPGELRAALDFIEGDGEERLARFEQAERDYEAEQRRRIRRIERQTRPIVGRAWPRRYDFDLDFD